MPSYLDSRFQITRSREEPDRSHYIVTDTATGQYLDDAPSYDLAVQAVRDLEAGSHPRSPLPAKCAPLH